MWRRFIDRHVVTYSAGQRMHINSRELPSRRCGIKLHNDIRDGDDRHGRHRHDLDLGNWDHRSEWHGNDYIRNRFDRNARVRLDRLHRNDR